MAFLPVARENIENDILFAFPRLVVDSSLLVKHYSWLRSRPMQILSNEKNTPVFQLGSNLGHKSKSSLRSQLNMWYIWLNNPLGLKYYWSLIVHFLYQTTDTNPCWKFSGLFSDPEHAATRVKRKTSNEMQRQPCARSQESYPTMIRVYAKES